MKNITIFISLLLVLITSSDAIGSVFKFVVFARNAESGLFLKDARTGEKKDLQPWNETGNSYLVECSDIENTLITTASDEEFRLYHTEQEKATDWIELGDGESKSIQECIDDYLIDSKIKLDEFIVHNYLNEPIDNEVIAFRAHTDNFFITPDRIEFCRKSDVLIEWNELSKIKNIALRDYYDNVIWEKKNYQKTYLRYKDLKSATQDLKLNDEYRLDIVLKTGFMSNRQLMFRMVPLIFTSNDHYFMAKKTVNISWDSDFDVKSISIQKRNEGVEIWKRDQYSQKNFAGGDFDIDLKPKVEYRLIIETEKFEQQFIYDFTILLSDKEYQSLKMFASE